MSEMEKLEIKQFFAKVSWKCQNEIRDPLTGKEAWRFPWMVKGVAHRAMPGQVHPQRGIYLSVKVRGHTDGGADGRARRTTQGALNAVPFCARAFSRDPRSRHPDHLSSPPWPQREGRVGVGEKGRKGGKEGRREGKRKEKASRTQVPEWAAETSAYPQATTKRA